ncbi:hypothetical protein SEA_WEASELS2_166 [Rhodococcus phage Weasels2]|uniref:Uncharacterized protein n=1 Tax=Rhodococcus phage Weasels2 TaxID=1897437 RepID=A0A1I9SAD9_9CAUD|nr:hypothetical protein FDH04_gp249 [Rhodococcus phage Weasels2]AOZ63745.1 hypothetical protein SEA_WEASELS2_166 [Rhodococcus phage Weasels2]
MGIFVLAVYIIGWLITSIIIFSTYDTDIVDKIEDFDDFMLESLRLLASVVYALLWPVIIPVGILYLFFGILYRIFLGIRWFIDYVHNKDLK